MRRTTGTRLALGAAAMVRKLFTVLGVLFVLGLVAGAGAALMLVKDRIRVIVQEDAAATGPDPVALVRDDVATLQHDLAALAAALPGNFERLGQALDERAETRHADVQHLAAAVAAVQTALVASERRLAALQERVDVLAAARAAAPTDSAPPSAPIAAANPTTPPNEPPTEPANPTNPQASQQVSQETTAPPTEPANAQQPVATPPEPKAAPGKRAGFLSFSVPDTKFRFDAEQTFAIVPELSRVGFDAKSTLHDFTGVTSKVAGEFTARLDDPAGAFRGEVTCEAASLSTGLEGRDTNMREHLDTEHNPQIRFAIAGFKPDAIDAEKRTCKGTIRGTMTIRGKSKEFAMPVEIAVDESRRAVVTGQSALRLSDYEVPVPSQLGGTITMQDEVSVWVALRARVRTGSGK